MGIIRGMQFLENILFPDDVKQNRWEWRGGDKAGGTDTVSDRIRWQDKALSDQEEPWGPER